MKELSFLSSADLEAVAAGDMARVSDQGLNLIANGGKSAAYQAGRTAPGALQGLASVIQGPLMGFGDEIIGAGQALADKLSGAPGSFGERYTERRDTLRGMQDAQREENPWTTGLTQAAASAPLAFLGPARTARAPVGMLANSGRAATSGAIYGGIGGAGNSTESDLEGILADAGKGAIIGAATGGAVTPVAAGVGAVGGNIAQRVSNPRAASFAQEKIAEALARDARGSVFTSGASSPTLQAQARLAKMGPDGALVDAGGRNTIQLLDTLATLPGRTKDAAFAFQRQRTATAPERLISAADSALGTGGQRLSTTVDSLIASRRDAAGPLYDQLRGVGVTVDDDIVSLLNRTKGHHTEAQNLYRLATGEDIALGALKPGQRVPFQVLDNLKQSLDDAGMAAKRGGNNKLGAAVDSARLALLAKLDEVAPQVGGQSVYRAARDAFSGPSQLIDAAELGRAAVRQDEAAISSAIRGMTTSELEAFRIGAFDGLRTKLGTMAGQTNILNMWKEPTTREKLKLIFGNERGFREFASAAASESVKKRVQNVGQGSQTAARMAGMGDLDAGAIGEATALAGSAKTGNIAGALGAARNLWGRVATPQTVRDEMGRLLMQQGPQARQTLQSMDGLLQQINRNNTLLADNVGLGGGLIGGGLLGGR